MRLVIFVTVSLLATPLLAASQSQTKQAEELEAKIKQPCVPRLEERPETPLDYRRCGEGKMVGTDAWYRCTSELERLHRAVFFGICLSNAVQRRKKGAGPQGPAPTFALVKLLLS